MDMDHMVVDTSSALDIKRQALLDAEDKLGQAAADIAKALLSVKEARKMLEATGAEQPPSQQPSEVAEALLEAEDKLGQAADDIG